MCPFKCILYQGESLDSRTLLFGLLRTGIGAESHPFSFHTLSPLNVVASQAAHLPNNISLHWYPLLPFSFSFFCFSKGGQPCAGGGGLCGETQLPNQWLPQWMDDLYMYVYREGFGHCCQTIFLLLTTECGCDLVEAPVATEMCTKEWPSRLTSSLIINNTTTCPWFRRAQSLSWSI